LILLAALAGRANALAARHPMARRYLDVVFTMKSGGDRIVP
jgi:hypothetical protein